MIGCGGSGKTTVSRELGRRLDLPVRHIDGYYWRGQNDPPKEEWPRIHGELVAAEQWVIDGMKIGVLRERLARADTVVFLDLPRRTCFAGVAQRRIEFRGRLHPDLGVYDRISWAFIRWIWGFGRRQRPQILALLGECSCRVVVLRSRREVRRFLASLPAAADVRASGSASAQQPAMPAHIRDESVNHV